MSEISHDWLVIHRVVFNDAIDGNDNPLAGPDGAEAWRFYPTSPPGQNGVRTSISREWGGFGIYTSRAAAQAVFDAPADHLPFLGQAREHWHALAVPYAHRGRVNWRDGKSRDENSIIVAPSDPAGPLLVMTSAGFEDAGSWDPKRIANFIDQVEQVVEFYGTLPGNIRRAVYSGVAVDRIDGMTISLWKDDAAMMQAAYKAGHHREQMEYHRTVGHFDRSSFTRTRIIDSKGSWDGSDPVAEMS